MCTSDCLITFEKNNIDICINVFYTSWFGAAAPFEKKKCKKNYNASMQHSSFSHILENYILYYSILPRHQNNICLVVAF